MPAPLSLKGRALALLAQREQSPLELKRKLLRHALSSLRREPLPGAEAASGSGLSAAEDDAGSDAGHHGSDAIDPDAQREAAGSMVDDVILWLQTNGHLSERRFVESRVHARAPRYGNQRIRQELSHHGLTLAADDAADLKQSELARAQDVWLRKYRVPAADATARARQARFLIGRGFSGDVVRKVVLGTRTDKTPRD